MWNQGPGRRSSGGMPSPRRASGGARTGDSPYRGSPVPPAQSGPGGQYYEDVDPRFAGASARTAPAQNSSNSLHPRGPPTDSYEDIRDIPQGARSPAESDKSNFTSISQRGINPRWNPPPPSQQGYGMTAVPRRPLPPSTNDVLLNANPDFELPGTRTGQLHRGPGTTPRSSYPPVLGSPR